MKRFIQHVLDRFGFDLHRRRPEAPAFRPYVEQVSLVGVGFSFWVGDPIGEKWYKPEEHSGFAEHTETARLIRPGDKVLEIGTHHGFYAMLLSKLVGDGGFVLGVEPSPFNALMASAQIGLNRAANFRVLHAAASDRKGNVRISEESNAVVTESDRGIEVPAITVDELDSMFGPFNVLKVDVEGFERQVLAGAAKLLQRRPLIFLELHSPLLPQFGSTIESVLDLIGPPYQGTFVPRGTRHQVHAFPAKTLPRDDIVNLFLEHPSPV
jgi:FkbM family methyltransferase